MGDGEDFQEGEETQTVYYFGESYGADRDPDSGDYFLETLIGGVALLGLLAIVILIAVSH